jgi:hypothetical protein
MRGATLLASLLPLAWAAVVPAADKPAGSQTVSVAGSQPAAKGPAEYFTGNARVEPLFAAQDTAPTTAMTHIALTGMDRGKNVDWLEKVSDEQYRKR